MNPGAPAPSARPRWRPAGGSLKPLRDAARAARRQRCSSDSRTLRVGRQAGTTRPQADPPVGPRTLWPLWPLPAARWDTPVDTRWLATPRLSSPPKDSRPVSCSISSSHPYLTFASSSLSPFHTSDSTCAALRFSSATAEEPFARSSTLQSSSQLRAISVASSSRLARAPSLLPDLRCRHLRPSSLSFPSPIAAPTEISSPLSTARAPRIRIASHRIAHLFLPHQFPSSPSHLLPAPAASRPACPPAWCAPLP